jgi:tetratricopeptide (TPR) repeat protein
LLALGQPGRAIVELEAELEVDRPVRLVPTLASLGLAYGLVGRRADALKILHELEQASKKRYVSPYYIAIVCSGLGQMDKAFRLLEQALATRSTYLVIGCAPVDPCLNAFRRDPRWKSFIERFRQQVRLPPGTPNPYS